MIRIVVPCTSGNMGSGFDAIGIALTAFPLMVDATPYDGPVVITDITGQGANQLPKDATNRVLVAATNALKRIGKDASALRAKLVIHSEIPLARGLGSSAAAAVAGALLADAMTDGAIGKDGVLTAAAELEGHSDNVAPALYGGVQVSVHTDQGFLSCNAPINATLAAALFVPDEPLTTQRAREVLPATISRADAVFNLGRSALTIAALASGEPTLLRESLRDRIHQPPRTQLMPWLPKLIAAAEDAGAFGAALSGAGTTVAALTPVGRENAIADAMARAAASIGLAGRALHCQIDRHGASVTKV